MRARVSFSLPNAGMSIFFFPEKSFVAKWQNPSSCDETREEKRNETTRLLPVMAHKFHDRPIAKVRTNEHGILTSCDSGKVKLWSRPVTKERYLTFIEEEGEEG